MATIIHGKFESTGNMDEKYPFLDEETISTLLFSMTEEELNEEFDKEYFVIFHMEHGYDLHGFNDEQDMLNRIEDYITDRHPDSLDAFHNKEPVAIEVEIIATIKE